MIVVGRFALVLLPRLLARRRGAHRPRRAPAPPPTSCARAISPCTGSSSRSWWRARCCLRPSSRRDFSFAYVAQNSDSSLSVFYRVAGFWAGAAGLVSALAAAARRSSRSSSPCATSSAIDRLTAVAVGVLAAVAAVFAVLMVADQGSNPFLVAAAGTAARGLNPLLLHPAMVFHPPVLFLRLRRSHGAVCLCHRGLAARRAPSATGCWAPRSWTVAGWAFLTLGIGLGAWWAYVVLSFGGYWGWDPVENTSLIPWLTATALLHSMTLYRRRGLLRRSTLALACATFWLTIVATWTTRTGLITSVHAFERNDTLIAILSSLLVAVAALSIGLAGLALAAVRRGGSGCVALASRDVACYLTDVALGVFAAALLVATVVVPLITRPHGRPRHLPPVRPAARRGGGGGHRALPAARPGAGERPSVLARRCAGRCSPRPSRCRCCWRPATGARASSAWSASRSAALPPRPSSRSSRRARGGPPVSRDCSPACAARSPRVARRSAAYVAHCRRDPHSGRPAGLQRLQDRAQRLPRRPGSAPQRRQGASRCVSPASRRTRGRRARSASSAHFVVTRDGRRVGTLAPYTDIYPQAGAADCARSSWGACPATCSSSPRTPSTRRAPICGCSSTSFRSSAWCGPASSCSSWAAACRCGRGASARRSRRVEPRERGSRAARAGSSSRGEGALEPRDEALEGKA